MNATVLIIHSSDIIRKGLLSILRVIPGIELKAHNRFDGVDIKVSSRYLVIFDNAKIDEFEALKKISHCQNMVGVPLHWEFGSAGSSHTICISSTEEEIRGKVRSILKLADIDLQTNGSLSQREID